MTMNSNLIDKMLFSQGILRTSYFESYICCDDY